MKIIIYIIKIAIVVTAEPINLLKCGSDIATSK